MQVVEDGDRPVSGDLAPPAPGVVVQCFRVALGGTDGEDELREFLRRSGVPVAGCGCRRRDEPRLERGIDEKRVWRTRR